ncbi:thylakoid-associated protein [cyanobacterium TDX16]|nr:thylakoid-associated protein [cyanobacterium TDX16]
MAKQSTSEVIEAIASEIGENVYIDIAKWHLYLADAKLHTLLAEQLYPILTARSLSEDRVQQILQNIPVKLGGGKKEIPLIDLIPARGQTDLMEILEKYQNDM